MSGPFGSEPLPVLTFAQRREIATRCRCPMPGEPLRLGDVVALAIEPGDPFGRVVGLLRHPAPGVPRILHVQTQAVVVREFRQGDSWFPTGPLRRGVPGIAWTAWIGAPLYREVS